jgi:hypothetical protein
MEGNSGQKGMTFKVLLSHPSVEPMSFYYWVTEGSAKVNLDYYPSSSEFLLNPGNTWAKIYVYILGDRIKESDETLFFNIAPATGTVRFKNNQAVGTISNDD